jgi:hypothetical protein
MQIYQGVIEDIDDPLKLGRVRVRVYGLHTDDKDLIPTNTLPWAIVLMPVTSASMSGIGISPSGLLPGSWVLVTFSDPNNQFPIVLGSTHGIPDDLTSQIAADEEIEFTDSETPRSQNVLRDSSGAPVTDSSGEPIRTTPAPANDQTAPAPAPEEKKPSPLNSKVIPSELGSISEKYESGGRGPGVINSYKNGNDAGGASYGTYQFATYITAPGVPTRDRYTPSMIANSPLNQFLRQSKFGSEFTGLQPATPEFDAKWKEVARLNKEEFKADQHLYIERVYYQVAANRISSNITNRGRAIHEAIWSMSVQLGPGGCVSKFKSTVGSIAPSVCDDKLIEILYDSRISTVKSDFRSSPNLWPGLISRFNDEKAKLISLAKSYQTGDCESVVEVTEQKIVYTEDQKKTIVEEKRIESPRSANSSTPVNNSTSVGSGSSFNTNRKKGERGFSDPSLRYPLYYNEADTNRLARGILTGTIVPVKRSSVITGRAAGATSISEPVTQFNAKYPFNKVTVTESGHIIEYDDTPGHERVHIYHRSGTFIELYPDGKMVTKVRDNNTLVVNADNNTIVLGSSNTNIEENKNETIGGTLTVNIIGDANLDIGGNLKVNIGGNMDVTAGGVMNFRASKINMNR